MLTIKQWSIMTAPTVWACAACGCTDVEVEAWATSNGGRAVGVGHEGPGGAQWCPTCETHDADLVEVDPSTGAIVGSMHEPDEPLTALHGTYADPLTAGARLLAAG